MSVITTPIQPQAFEIVRDRLGEILADELPAQLTLTGDQALDVTVWRERLVSFNHDELGAVNIMFVGGPTAADNAKQASGTYSYYIDCYQAAKAVAGTDIPDLAALTKLHRVMGVVRGIIMDARYRTLGFAPPFISSRDVVNIIMGDPQKMESTTMVFGRIEVRVVVREIVDLKLPVLLDEFVTQTRLDSTDNGYIWSGSTP